MTAGANAAAGDDEVLCVATEQSFLAGAADLIWSERVGSLSALADSLGRARSVAGPSLVELDLGGMA
jgi:hypothetical protein